ncbi:hypothetical protein FQN54_003186 [Arachnomyces sp. PD_36]|nr:hypothetical protein FQN54_003186 [Arachnomyces sp. PD_36]
MASTEVGGNAPEHTQTPATNTPSNPASSNNDPAKTIKIGSRSSKLALVQADAASALLSKAHPDLTFPITTVMVAGDSDKTTPFLQFAGKTGGSDAAKNLWTEEMEIQMCAGGLDILVHSLKDLPMLLPEGCELGAVIEREDPRDSLLVKPGLPYKSLADLPHGAVVGSSSTRRKALLKKLYPHLVVQECRGNIDTRLRKLDAPDSPFSCIILATAGLNRINLQHRITAHLDPVEFPYAVGQGALGVEIRTNDERITNLLKPIEHKNSKWMCLSERAMLRKLQGGCSSPVGVNTVLKDGDGEGDGGKTIKLQGRIIHPHGTSEIIAEAEAVVSSDADAEALGQEVAQKLFDTGARELLQEIKKISNAFGQQAGQKEASAS